MSWVKVDDTFPTHRKVLRAGAEASAMWLFLLCHSNRYRLDGRIAKGELGEAWPWARAAELAAKLVTAGLLEDCGDHWQIHDYLDYQPARVELDERAAKARDRKRAQRVRERGADRVLGDHAELASVSRCDYSVTPLGLTRDSSVTPRGRREDSRVTARGVTRLSHDTEAEVSQNRVTPHPSRPVPSRSDPTCSALVGGAGGSGELEPPGAERPKKRAWTRVPPAWNPGPEHENLAKIRGIDLEAEAAKFRDHEFSSPKRDADAAFRNWLRSARPESQAYRQRGAPIRQQNSGYLPPME